VSVGYTPFQAPSKQTKLVERRQVTFVITYYNRPTTPPTHPRSNAGSVAHASLLPDTRVLLVKLGTPHHTATIPAYDGGLVPVVAPRCAGAPCLSVSRLRLGTWTRHRPTDGWCICSFGSLGHNAFKHQSRLPPYATQVNRCPCHRAAVVHAFPCWARPACLTSLELARRPAASAWYSAT
jgi:hypothetical protein